jgi:uncharacterized protein with von Willebrand factor type A (vWA) domain
MEQTPLYRLFNALRQQAHMALGIDDYLVALEAMQQGFGLNGRDDLCQLCQIIWVTSEEERHLFLSVFNELYPPEPEKVERPSDSQQPEKREVYKKQPKTAP